MSTVAPILWAAMLISLGQVAPNDVRLTPPVLRVASAPTAEAQDAAYAQLRESGAEEKAIKAGAMAPPFLLSDQFGKAIDLRSLLGRGPVVLVWAHGAWSARSRALLHDYASGIGGFMKRGVSVIAILAERPERNLDLYNQLQLPFEVLTDTNARVSRIYGLLYRLPDAMWSRLIETTHLTPSNLYGNQELPILGVYLLDRNGKIVWSKTDVDSRKAATPNEVLQAIDRTLS